MHTKSKLLLSVILNAIITLTEVIGGLISGSLALLGDSLHNFNDTMALGISYIAIRVGERDRNAKYTFGYKRAEILGAFINSVILVAVGLFLIYEAYRRFLHPSPINSALMLVVAFIGLFANLFTALLLHKHAHESMNVKSAYLHIIGDTVSSIAVIIGGLAILWWGVVWIDPLISVLISVYIIFEGFKILRDSVDILMEASPDIDLEKIKREIEEIDGVVNAHHFHAWRVGENDIFLECHIDVEDMPISQAQRIIDEIQMKVREFGVTHVTVQMECGRCKRKATIGEES